MKARGWVILALGVVVLVVAGIAWGLTRPYTFHGSLLDPAAPAPDFTLTDQNGEPFRLSDHHDRVVLIYFGYTHCPDVCPATLALFKQARERLGPQADGARFIFITIDPDRDTSERLREHLNRIDPVIVGLTGTLEELEPVWAAYGVYRLEQPGTGETGPLFDHSARVYVVDRHGELRLTFPFGFDVDEFTQDVSHLIQEP
jgi:protein SCO1/2